MSEFSERLSGLMFENNLNRKQFAQQSDINATCITHYLQGKHSPTLENLVKIADFFHRSTDFLLGREEENNALTFKPCPPFPEQLKFLKDYFQCSSYQIYHNTNIPKSCYYDWKYGNRQPTLENVIKLAEHFDCRIDFIIGREK